MVDIKKIADEAEMIVNGYAFSLCPEGYRVLNLNCPDKATVFSPDMDVLETSMDYLAGLTDERKPYPRRKE